MANVLYRDPGAVTSVGLLIIRVVAGIAFMIHGWGKLTSPEGAFGWMGEAMPGYLQGLAVLAEFGGGLAWILGLLTPLASLGLLCTMAVAVWTHASKGDPFVGSPASYELAAVYLALAILLLAAGPGRFSLDRLIFGRVSVKDKRIFS